MPCCSAGKRWSEAASSRLMATAWASSKVGSSSTARDTTVGHHYAPSAQHARQLFQHRGFGLHSRQAPGERVPSLWQPPATSRAERWAHEYA
jgi:hypothetical protein